MAGVWNWVIFKVSYNPNHSVILEFQNELIGFNFIITIPARLAVTLSEMVNYSEISASKMKIPCNSTI